MAPRSSSSSGSFCDMAVAARRMQLKVPIRLISTTFLNTSRSWAEPYSPSLPMVRVAQPMPAQLTSDAQRAQLLGRLDRGDDLVGVGDVGVGEHAADLLGEGLALVVLHVEHHDDLGAPLGEEAGGGLAEARGATGDDC